MPSPRKIHVLAPEDFDRLLAWLDQDREQAGRIYENLRGRLITIFAARKCPIPEELADETMDRVARRVADIANTYAGDKARYFFGVANNVHHEYLKRPVAPEAQEEFTGGESAEPDQERVHDCLERCLGQLPAGARETILRYYSQDKQAKIELRVLIAGELGISLNTLRLRVLRWKEKLQPCVERCLECTDVF